MNPEPTHKKCSKCGEKKLFAMFCKGKARFGLTSWCKPCVAEKKRADRLDPAKRDMVQAQYRRNRESPARKKWHREDVMSGRAAERSKRSSKKYYAGNREKILRRQRDRRKDPAAQHRFKCNQLVGLMVYFGLLEKGPCVVCGSETSEAAHRSYDDPLDIFWACPRHHRQYDHGLIDEAGNEIPPS